MFTLLFDLLYICKVFFHFHFTGVNNCSSSNILMHMDYWMHIYRLLLIICCSQYLQENHTAISPHIGQQHMEANIERAKWWSGFSTSELSSLVRTVDSLGCPSITYLGCAIISFYVSQGSSVVVRRNLFPFQTPVF